MPWALLNILTGYFNLCNSMVGRGVWGGSNGGRIVRTKKDLSRLTSIKKLQPNCGYLSTENTLTIRYLILLLMANTTSKFQFVTCGYLT